MPLPCRTIRCYLSVETVLGLLPCRLGSTAGQNAAINNGLCGNLEGGSLSDYIAQIEGDYYEGTHVKLRLITPQPVILSSRLEDKFAHSGSKIIFVEDYFNSGTRIRRGRLYMESNKKSWSPENISPKPVSTDIDPSGVIVANVNESYETYTGQDKKYGSAIVLGDGSVESRWRVVLAERVLSDGLMVTLNSKTFLGVLPDVVLEAIPEKNRQDILQAIDAVVESATSQAPQPVIDTCRNDAFLQWSAA